MLDVVLECTSGEFSMRQTRSSSSIYVSIIEVVFMLAIVLAGQRRHQKTKDLDFSSHMFKKATRFCLGSISLIFGFSRMFFRFDYFPLSHICTYYLQVSITMGRITVGQKNSWL